VIVPVTPAVAVLPDLLGYDDDRITGLVVVAPCSRTGSSGRQG
jgi:hypothetical protein